LINILGLTFKTFIQLCRGLVDQALLEIAEGFQYYFYVHIASATVYIYNMTILLLWCIRIVFILFYDHYLESSKT